jgi:hypothetical protein
MKDADATERDRVDPVGDLIMDVGGGEDRTTGIAQDVLIEATLDLAFAIGELLTPALALAFTV